MVVMSHDIAVGGSSESGSPSPERGAAGDREVTSGCFRASGPVAGPAGVRASMASGPARGGIDSRARGGRLTQNRSIRERRTGRTRRL